MRLTKLFSIAITSISILFSSLSYTAEVPISLFNLQNYNQNVHHWLSPTDHKCLISKKQQQQRLENFKQHLFGKDSPWSQTYVTNRLNQSAPDDIYGIQQLLIDYYGNENKDPNKIRIMQNLCHSPQRQQILSLLYNLQYQVKYTDYWRLYGEVK